MNFSKPCPEWASGYIRVPLILDANSEIGEQVYSDIVK